MNEIAPTCRCGHARDAHEHFRRGSDCGACGAASCSRFRAGRGHGRTLAPVASPTLAPVVAAPRVLVTAQRDSA